MIRPTTSKVAPATTTAKHVMPRVAALLDVAQISDIVAVESADTFVRSIYAGNVLATVRSADPVKVVTVRTTAFVAASAEGGNAAIDALERAAEVAGSRFVSQQLTRSERPELTAAQRVISGGRGMGAGENFALLDGRAGARRDGLHRRDGRLPVSARRTDRADLRGHHRYSGC
ncbi:MAG: electron transfer flavoprotein alpha subunit [Paraburkholderia sp.]|jgi:electron transfer flavoprotein alpha subunit|nr:electron transfer flavoprotein alpha subunit [Paraburkholderia sp.]